MSSRALRRAVLLLAVALAALAALEPAGAEDEKTGASAPRHRAFAPLVRPGIPDPRGVESARTPIDRFIIARLEEQGLRLRPEADRAVLLRRLSFDLTGLPPTLEEIDAFLHDPSPDAYEHAVDRCLASPGYGERWGKHWLDAAGYADSNGYFHADTERPLAYKYRDYVIRSMNEDKAFDRFLFEQIAGDELVGYEQGGDVTPDMVDPLVATHFLRNGPDGTGESDGNPLERRIDKLKVLEAEAEIIGSALLGLTLQCARCHDHKFEPVTQKEYYALQAVLAGAFSPERWLKPNDRTIPIGTIAEREEHRRQTTLIDAQVAALEESLERVRSALRRQLIDERIRALDAPDEAATLRSAIEKAEKDRKGDEKALLEKHAKLLEVSDGDLERRFPELPPLEVSIDRAIAARKKERPPPLEKIAAVFDVDPEPLPHHVLERGVYTAAGEEVPPGVPAALTTRANRYAVEPVSSAGKPVSSGRRTAFARWLVSGENPVVARVLANRIWQRHFGRGLAATTENLGRSGEPPSHPELLDWLAAELVESGWSLKAIHRLIVCSAVYRQSTRAEDGAGAARAREIDPENRLLWRFPLRRIDAESVRDAILAISGELDRRMYGPFVRTHRRDDGQVVVEPGEDGAGRRSIYLQQRRTQVPTLLEVFDAPSIETSCTRRTSSTIPLQSLALLNSEFALSRARALAARLESAAPDDRDARLRRAFRLAIGREPDREEIEASARFLDAQVAHYAGRDDARALAWSDFSQMLLSSNAFLYIE